MANDNVNIDGFVTHYRLGLCENDKSWARLTVDLGPALEATVKLTSRQARELAVQILAEQGPELSYEPPNDRMKESKTFARGFGKMKRDAGWQERERIDNVESRLLAAIKDVPTDTARWAISRVIDRLALTALETEAT